MLKTGEVSKILGIPRTTLQYWDRTGKFKPTIVDPNSGYRYYEVEKVKSFKELVEVYKNFKQLEGE